MHSDNLYQLTQLWLFLVMMITKVMELKALNMLLLFCFVFVTWGMFSNDLVPFQSCLQS